MGWFRRGASEGQAGSEAETRPDQALLQPCQQLAGDIGDIGPPRHAEAPEREAPPVRLDRAQPDGLAIALA